jgi:hypothetical protein
VELRYAMQTKQTKQKVKTVGDQSKKIKKPIGNKFGALVQDKVSKKARILDDVLRSSSLN